MKKLFLLSMLFSFAVIAKGQDEYYERQPVKDKPDPIIDSIYRNLPKVDGLYEFNEVVKLESSFTKDLLYKKSKSFFANVFKNANAVIQYDDKDEGKIIGKGNLKVIVPTTVLLTKTYLESRVNFSIEIFSKDGKYRYRIYDIKPESGSIDDLYSATFKGTMKKGNRKLFVKMIDEIKATAELIKQYMSSSTSNTNDDF